MAWTNEDYLADFEQTVERAKANGFEIVYGSDKLLCLDLDTPENMKTYKTFLSHLRSAYPELGAYESGRWKSKSGIGWHVTVSVKRNLDIPERLMLQVALGSDPLHEMLSLISYWRGNMTPTVLFKPTKKSKELEL